MVKATIYAVRNLFKVHLIEENQASLRGIPGATPVSEAVLLSLDNALQERYSGNHRKVGPDSYLIEGTHITLTRQGHKHYKEVLFESDSREGLTRKIVELLKEVEFV